MIRLSVDASNALFEHTLEFAARQLRRLMEQHPDFYPMYTSGGRWKHGGEAWTHWCDGFLPGMLWIIGARQAEGSASESVKVLDVAQVLEQSLGAAAPGEPAPTT